MFHYLMKILPSPNVGPSTQYTNLSEYLISISILPMLHNKILASCFRISKRNMDMKCHRLVKISKIYLTEHILMTASPAPRFLSRTGRTTTFAAPLIAKYKTCNKLSCQIMDN